MADNKNERPCGGVLEDVDDVTEADVNNADFDAEEVSE